MNPADPAPNSPLPPPALCPKCGAPMEEGSRTCRGCLRRARRALLRLMLIWAVAAFLLNGVVALWQRLSVDERSWLTPAGPQEILLPLITLPCFLAIVMGLIFMVVRGSRAFGYKLLSCAGVFLVASVVAAALFEQPNVREQKIEEAVKRGVPLIAAIKSYEQRHGRPPASLDELVPALLPAVPSPGLGNNPFEYLVGEQADVHPFKGNPWVLTVAVPKEGFIAKADLLMYFPRQNYPARGYRGPVIRRIKDWALDVD